MRDSWDRDLDPLAALAQGDSGLFERFVRTEAPTFAGFFGRLGADPQEAEDLTQDLFLKLYTSASHYVPSERFTAYAFRVARNAWIDRTRRRATRGEGAGSRSEEEPPGEQLERAPSEVVGAARRSESREESARLYTALASLSEMHRAVFELGALQQLSYAEVSEILGVPVGTVKSRMFYAVRRLRELLGGGAETGAPAAKGERP